jgi:hypothetical protein
MLCCPCISAGLQVASQSQQVASQSQHSGPAIHSLAMHRYDTAQNTTSQSDTACANQPPHTKLSHHRKTTNKLRKAACAQDTTTHTSALSSTQSYTWARCVSAQGCASTALERGLQTAGRRTCAKLSAHYKFFSWYSLEHHRQLCCRQRITNSNSCQHRKKVLPEMRYTSPPLLIPAVLRMAPKVASAQ